MYQVHLRCRMFVRIGFVALALAVAVSFATTAEPAPRFHWNFDKVEAGKAPNLGKQSARINVAKWSENRGVGDSGALICGKNIRSIKVYFPELKSGKATIALAFKPTAPVTKQAVLFSYAEHSYGRGVFDVFLDGKGHIGARFLLRAKDAKTVLKRMQCLSAEKYSFQVGQWNTARVTMEQGGAIKVYLNERLAATADDSMCFADLDGPIAKEYPLLGLGWQVWSGKPIQPFSGMIDEIRIWEDVVPPQPAAGGEARAGGEAVIVSKTVATAPVVDGKLDDACWKEAERTRPFAVLRKPHPTITGLLIAPNEKFLKNAATAQVCHNKTHLYVAYRAPAPADAPASAKITQHDGRVWGEDCVELFLDPMRRKGFYQFLVNAIGVLADAESLPGTGAFNLKWESQAIVKAQKDGHGFTVEMAIPFASLGDLPHTPGTAWGINFTRSGKSSGGLSTWAPVGRVFATPERFGLLVFESRKAFHQKELARLEAELAKTTTEKTRALAVSVGKHIASLKRKLRTGGEAAAHWNSFRNATDEIAGTLCRIAMQGRTYLLWQKDIWGNVSLRENVPADTVPLAGIKVFSAQNTFPSTGFLLSNLSDKPLMGRLLLEKPTKVAPLPEGMSLLESKRIEFRRGVHIELNNGLMIPDALAALPIGSLVEVPPHSTIIIWLELDTRGLTGGNYLRTVKFFPSYSGFDPTAFDINLEVAPVDLAAVRIRQWSYLNKAQAILQPYIVKDLVRHGVTMVYFLPGQLDAYPKFDAEGNIVEADFTVLDNAIALMQKTMDEAGVSKEQLSLLFNTNFTVPCYRRLPHRGKGQLTYGSDAWKKGFGNWLKATRDHLFEKGFIYEDFAVYTFDEPHGDPNDPKSRAHMAIRLAYYVKEADPKIRIMTNPSLKGENAKWLPAYLEAFDILEPYRGHLQLKASLAKQLRESGREIWTYHILGKPNVPGVYRNLFWQSARDGFTGTCPFWAYLDSSTDPFNSYDGRPWNPRRTFDYAVIYEDTERKKIIPSRRLKAWYQGNQDYRAVATCRSLIAKLKAAGKDVSAHQQRLNHVISSAVNQSCAKMDASRERLIRMALEMQKILDQ